MSLQTELFFIKMQFHAYHSRTGWNHFGPLLVKHLYQDELPPDSNWQDDLQYIFWYQIDPTVITGNHSPGLTHWPLGDFNFITLGPREACVWAKHPSLTIPVPSRGEPSRHLGSSYQQGVSILSPLIADFSGLWGSSMQVMHGRPQGLFSRWQGG